ncbi:hypothetical protein KW791_03155 [Candidatus Parcubacteria bacterium]|nr:hypothetical protein [Candidatus Parcubacteria bacterium]
MKRFTFLVIVIGIAAALPFGLLLKSIDNWQGIMPNYVTDANFYFTRIAKGTDSFPFGNNPYFIEHLTDINATPSVADPLASIPLKLGVPFAATMIFNAVFWNILFVIILYFLIKRLGVRGYWPHIFSLLIYFEVYWLAVRPAIMEVVFPFFAVFLLALVNWLQKQTRGRELLLSAAFAATFYVYAYTLEVSSVILIFIGLYTLWTQDWDKLKSIIRVGFGAFILGLPVFIYIYKEISHPLFSEFISIRAGSIQTHLPSLVAFQLARWIILNLFAWFIARKFIANLRNSKEFSLSYLIVSCMGLGLLALLMSPLIIGRDTVIGEHISREIYLWLSLFAPLLVYFVIKHEQIVLSKQKIFIYGLLLLNLVPVFAQYKRSVLPLFRIDRKEANYVQSYAPPLKWLESKESRPVVVWADSTLSDYILVYSKHYVLLPGLNNNPTQYFVSDSELRERYILSSYFDQLDSVKIKRDYAIAVGNVDSIQIANVQFRLKLCQIFHMTSRACDPGVLNKLESIRDDKINKIIAESNQIKPKEAELLKKYRVKYVIKDLQKDSQFHPEQLGGAQVYNDGNFAIYQLKL